MLYSERKETVRLALLCAIEKRKGGEIARDIDAPRSSIHTYAKQGVAGPEIVESVETWLQTHGYLEGAPVQPAPDHPPEPWLLLARDLYALADILQSMVLGCFLFGPPLLIQIVVEALEVRKVIPFWYSSGSLPLRVCLAWINCLGRVGLTDIVRNEVFG